MLIGYFVFFMNQLFNSVDLFSGCGGLTLGMTKAGFKTTVAVEIDESAVKAFKLNHKNTTVLQKDIKEVQSSEILKLLNGEPLHFLAGCPPCQGFSSVRRLNRKTNVRDKRNRLLLEYLRLVRELSPLTIMMENVPGLKDFYLFKEVVRELKKLGYHLDFKVVNIKDYGIPQRRRRLVLVGSKLGHIKVASSRRKKRTVRDAIFGLSGITKTKDPIHKVFAKHSDNIMEMIKLIPKNGGSRSDLPKKYILECHLNDEVGFNDIYGRLRWDDYSTTITGGCLNPSKGRFLHPRYNRSITAREAALLQSFPKSYKFPVDITKTNLALIIGNALPPTFSFIQSRNIRKHLISHLET
jgi:DNA (cytosine-5)-methyltransferase 1